MVSLSKRHDSNDFPFGYVILSMIVLFIGFLARLTVWNFFFVSAAITFAIFFIISKERALLYLAKFFVILDALYLSSITEPASLDYVAYETLKDLYLMDHSSVFFRISLVIIALSFASYLTRVIPLYLSIIHALEIPYVFPLISLSLLDISFGRSYEGLAFSGLARLRSFVKTPIGPDVISVTVILYSVFGFPGAVLGILIRAYTIDRYFLLWGSEGFNASFLYVLREKTLLLLTILTIATLAQIIIRKTRVKRPRERNRG